MKSAITRTAGRRKRIPDRVKLLATLRHFGLAIQEVEYDHYPALSLRKWSERKRDFVPPQNDPEHIRLTLLSLDGPREFRATLQSHAAKTFGPGAERRIHTRGSDVSEPRRMSRIGEKHADFCRRVFGPVKRKAAKSRKPKRRIQSRNDLRRSS